MMDTLFPAILNMSLNASFVIAAVLLLRLALKRAPRWIAYALWAMVLVRLLCPWNLQSALSLLPSAEPIPATAFTQEPAMRAENPVPNDSADPEQTQDVEPTPEMPAIPAQPWTQLLPTIWLAGAAAMLAYALFATLRFGRRIRFATKLEGEENVFVCDAIRTAFVWGVFKPRIYLPDGLTQEQRAHILAHERTHIRRLDHLTRPLAFLALALHLFNPLVWLAYCLSGRDMELSCDESVLRHGIGDRKAYASTLLTVSQRRSGLAAPLAFGQSSVKARIQSALLYKKPAFWLIVAAIVVAAAAAVCLLTDPLPKADAPTLTLPEQTYVFDTCLYNHPMRSYYPVNGTGLLYHFPEEGGLILYDKETGEERERHTGDTTAYALTTEHWNTLFQGSGAPSIEGYTTRLVRDLGDNYQLYRMDDEIWLGTFTEDGVMWELDRLLPQSAATPKPATTPLPQGMDMDATTARLTALQEKRLAEFLTQFERIPRGENGFAHGYKADWDGDGTQDSAALVQEPTNEEGYTVNAAVEVRFGNGEMFHADAAELESMSGWGHSFLLEAADLTGDGQNELVLLIDLGGNGGRGSYGLYPYVHTANGWQPMAASGSGATVDMEWENNIATLHSGTYTEVVATGEMLRDHYTQDEWLAPEWNAVDGVHAQYEAVADAICDIALETVDGKTTIKTVQYVSGITGVHIDQFGYLVTTYEWAQDGSYTVRDMRFVLLQE